MRKVRHCRFIQTGGRCDKDSLCSSPTPSSGGGVTAIQIGLSEWLLHHLFFSLFRCTHLKLPHRYHTLLLLSLDVLASVSLLHSSKTPLFSNILRSLQNSNIFSHKRQNSSQLWVWWVGVEVKDFAAAAAFMCSEKTYSHTPSMSSSVRLQTWLT